MKKFAAIITAAILSFLLFSACSRPKEPNAYDTMREYLPRVVEIKGPNGDGSGIVYRSGGGEVLVLTNYHVSGSEGAFISLRFYGESEYINADSRAENSVTVLGYDGYYDLALLRVKKKDAPSLPPPRFDLSPAIGEPAFTVGNGLGMGVTVGSGCLAGFSFISLSGESYKVLPLMQTSAPVNQGCSGGAVITGAGVAGICAYKQITFNGDYVQDVNFAIPAEITAKVIDKILASGGEIARLNVIAGIGRTLNINGKLTLTAFGETLKVKGGQYDGRVVGAVNGGKASLFALMAAAYESAVVLDLGGVTVTLD